jgi:hypothetical protein
MTLTDLRDLHLDETAVAGPGSPNFFNGRLLTGEDLAAEQVAGRAGDLRLGRLPGTGVAHGLFVTLADRGAEGVPRVQVTAGAAVTPSGKVLSLDADVRLELRRTPPPAGTAPSAFAGCAPAGPAPAGSAQLHLLTLRPAPPQAQGRARVLGLRDTPAPCAIDRLATGVQLRLCPFAVPLPPGQATRLRNHAAALLLGDAGDDAALVSDDPPAVDGGGLLEALRGRCYDAEEVPLAVVRWPSSAQGVEYVDCWAARRRCLQPGVTGDVHLLAPARRNVRAEARLGQFQDHLAGLAAASTGTQLVAREHFVRLPPAFVLRLRDAQTPAGIDAPTFFSGLTVRRNARVQDGPWVEGARVGELLAAAGSHPAVDASATPPEALWAYSVRPLRRAFGPPRDLLVVSGHVRYAADARYDLAHYNQASYAEAQI